jgi:hypothetical protein
MAVVADAAARVQMDTAASGTFVGMCAGWSNVEAGRMDEKLLDEISGFDAADDSSLKLSGVPDVVSGHRVKIIA